MGAHVQGDLERAKQMALRMDMFRGGAGEGQAGAAGAAAGKGQEWAAREKGSCPLSRCPAVGEGVARSTLSKGDSRKRVKRASKGSRAKGRKVKAVAKGVAKRTKTKVH